MIESFRIATDEITALFCDALAFKRLDDSATLGQLYGRMIDTSNSAFRLNVRSKFPMIYACKTTFSDEDVHNAIGLLNQFQINSDYFALLVTFREHQALRQYVRDSNYKNDFIVLHRDQVWEILAAKSPVQCLTAYILEQVDLVTVSPYTVGGPVPEKMFFGRAEEEKTILQNILQNNYALLANRKGGKTSLLNRVARSLSHISHYQVFQCDLQTVFDYQSFYKELAVYEEFQREIHKLSEPSALDFSTVIRNMQQSNSNRQIILIFDEVDELLAYDLQSSERLFKTFRSLSQRENVRFIFSGTTTLVERVRHPESPFFNFCEVMKIGLLNEEAAEELVKEPMRILSVTFEDEAAIVQRILALTARHPNIIQYTCDRLMKRINEKQQRINEKQQRTITQADLGTVFTSQEFYEYFESLLWGQATAMEKLIVYVMWSYPEFTKADVIRELTCRGLPTEEVEGSLETLQIHSIVSRENGTYAFTFREFAKLMEERNDIAALAAGYQQEVLKHDSFQSRRGAAS